MDFRRMVKCSNCGIESSIQVSSDLDMKELLFAGKCARCGGAMQINYNLVGDSSSSSSSLSSSSSSSTSSSSSSDSSTMPNLDESLFDSPKVDSDALRDLMDES